MRFVSFKILETSGSEFRCGFRGSGSSGCSVSSAHRLLLGSGILVGRFFRFTGIFAGSLSGSRGWLQDGPVRRVMKAVLWRCLDMPLKIMGVLGGSGGLSK